MIVHSAVVRGLTATQRCVLKGAVSGACEWGQGQAFRPFEARGRLLLTVTDPGYVMTSTVVEDAPLDRLPEGLEVEVATVDVRENAALRIQACWLHRRERLRHAWLRWRESALLAENARLGRIATQIDGHAAEAELELEELERQLAREKIKGQANVAELRAVKEEWSVLQRHNRELRTVAEEQDDEINRLRRLIEDEAYNDEEIAWRRIADVV